MSALNLEAEKKATSGPTAPPRDLFVPPRAFQVHAGLRVSLRRTRAGPCPQGQTRAQLAGSSYWQRRGLWETPQGQRASGHRRDSQRRVRMWKAGPGRVQEAQVSPPREHTAALPADQCCPEKSGGPTRLLLRDSGPNPPTVLLTHYLCINYQRC